MDLCKLLHSVKQLVKVWHVLLFYFYFVCVCGTEDRTQDPVSAKLRHDTNPPNCLAAKNTNQFEYDLFLIPSLECALELLTP